MNARVPMVIAAVENGFVFTIGRHKERSFICESMDVLVNVLRFELENELKSDMELR